MQEDSNLQSLRPERSALARLSHAQRNDDDRRELEPSPWWTSRESHPNHLLARQTSPLGDKPMLNHCMTAGLARRCGAQGSHLPPPARHAGAVARLPAPLFSSKRASWITCESNAVRAPYQRVQGDQPVVIRRLCLVNDWRAERELNPRAPFCRRRSSPENRLEEVGAVPCWPTSRARRTLGLRGAGRGNRTLIVSLEDCGPTVGRYPQDMNRSIASLDEIDEDVGDRQLALPGTMMHERAAAALASSAH